MSNAETEFKIIADPEIACIGKPIKLVATGLPAGQECRVEWTVESAPGGISVTIEQPMSPTEATLETKDLISGTYVIRAVATPQREPKSDASGEKAGSGTLIAEKKVVVKPDDSIERIAANMGRIADEGLNVNARKRQPSTDQAYWVSLRQCVDGRKFKAYSDFIDRVLCCDATKSGSTRCGQQPYPQIRKVDSDCYYGHGVHGYELLKAATEVYLLCSACCAEPQIDSEQFDREEKEELSRLDYAADVADLQGDLETYLSSQVSPRTVPYLDRIISSLVDTFPKTNHFPFCRDSLRNCPCLFELIWSYWHEEGMLVQTLNAISLRFQNRQVTAAGRSPLANFELDPLRPLNNFIWGYVQDEDRRLTVQRRAYEYDHEYGLKLLGKAVPRLQSAEPRSKFLEALHNLQHQRSAFYKEDGNRWITPDTFPLLNAIRAVHLLLAEGAHNQFGDLPSTARAEMATIWTSSAYPWMPVSAVLEWTALLLFAVSVGSVIWHRDALVKSGRVTERSSLAVLLAEKPWIEDVLIDRGSTYLARARTVPHELTVGSFAESEGQSAHEAAGILNELLSRKACSNAV